MSQFDTFIDKCPKCWSDSLFVVEVTFIATGKTATGRVPLWSDGFAFPPDDEDMEGDWSTENEKVECADCKAQLSLSDLLKQ